MSICTVTDIHTSVQGTSALQCTRWVSLRLTPIKEPGRVIETTKVVMVGVHTLASNFKQPKAFQHFGKGGHTGTIIL